jgi:type IV pilus assembly protein PilM
MPKVVAVWGIDIGNCSLKALRLRLGPEPDQVIADAFDYIEYPQILTQPGAEQPGQLVADALAQFLSRNDLRGTSVAVSVSGQNGLARFIKLPPVEARKIPDIVNYEAHQQIPFDLNDVIWDYQRMGGGLEEEGFVLEAEIGLFAMKRDQVLRALEPFDRAGIGVDSVQLAPLALYNFLVFDQLTDLPPADDYDTENPPPSTVILSMGTDASDLVVTNGFRVWQRSIPIGGNHFTKALVKELKLTFAKAEHLKRNASTAPEPKAVFQAMRQVFNELLTEVQRSIGYFTTLDRAAKVQRVLAMGNAMKLPGLRRFLAQGLGFDVQVLESFRGIAGPEVVGAPAFQENHLCFPVCYGLALQGVKKSAIRTNLIPKEIVKDRIIRGKKPWAVAAAAVFLLGCTISFVSYSRALATVDVRRFQDAEKRADAVTKEAKDFRQKADDAKAQMDKTNDVGTKLVQNVEGRFRWLELLRAVNACLPRDPEGKPAPDDLEMRQHLHIVSLDCQPLDSLDNWLSLMKQNNWLSAEDSAALPAGGGAAPDAAASAAPAPSASPAASGGETAGGQQAAEPVGWLIALQGYHYHNNREAFGENIGAQYIRNTLINKLRTGDVILPTDRATMKEMGLSCPVLINPGGIYEEAIVDRNAVLALEAAKASKTGPGAAAGTMGTMMTGSMPGMTTGSAAAKRSAGKSSSMPGAMPGSMMSGPGRTGGYSTSGRTGSRSPAMPGSMSGTGPGGTSDESETTIKVRRFDFTVQFVWLPTTPSERRQKRSAAGAPAATPGQGVPGEKQPAAGQPGVPGQGAPAAAQPGGGRAAGPAPEPSVLGLPPTQGQPVPKGAQLRAGKQPAPAEAE